ncbi:hypothetical protein ASPCADRAFT_132253 [Aspergillus carbonarius ITEM 5010]|uniref:Uncharacterized protein n=1 Tax=Aspergillus carbonarius (strain ITEM 5010) TaxID=602072 RepID=A0A1R3RHE4_ASPC5|nr:hypothetical protein ASPCADRAFT_132253 [Aspergillus carbonarius ITEM 5010]
MTEPPVGPLCRYCGCHHVEYDGVNLDVHIEQHIFPYGIKDWDRRPFGGNRVHLALQTTDMGRAIWNDDFHTLREKLIPHRNNEGQLPEPWTILGAAIYAERWKLLRELLTVGNVLGYRLRESLARVTVLEVHPMFQALEIPNFVLFKILVELNAGAIPVDILNYIIATQGPELIENILLPNRQLPSSYSVLVKGAYDQTPLHSSMINAHQDNGFHQVFQTVFQIFLDEVKRVALDPRRPETQQELLRTWLNTEASFANRPPYLTPFACAIVHRVDVAVEQLPGYQEFDISTPNTNGFTPLYFAVRYANIFAFNEIIQNGGKPSIRYSCPLGGTPKFAVVRAFKEMEIVVTCEVEAYRERIRRQRERGITRLVRERDMPLSDKVREIYSDMLRMASLLYIYTNKDNPHRHPLTGETAEGEADALEFDDLGEALRGTWDLGRWIRKIRQVPRDTDVQELYLI